MIFLNLTPHAITLRVEMGEFTFPPSGTIARVSVQQVTVGCLEMGIQVVRNEYGQVTGLPADGAMCIVSGMVLAALPAGTANVFAPDTGATAIRNEAGHIVAVTRLVAA